MATKYVKFLRGTPNAYKNLTVKDNDTLYFIYEEDEANGLLYLGSKLIAGGEAEGTGGVSKLSELKDVLISQNIVNNSFLTYDAKNSKWVNKSLEDLIFIGATDLSSGLSGLVPAPSAGQSDLFLKGDGTWGAPEVNHFTLTLENTSLSSHKDLIAEATDNIIKTSGDIVIIKDPIYENKWQYTAYFYDDRSWHAMDGNYNAENVYFDEDLITTTQIGNIALTNGKATIAAAGKNLKEIFNSIFVQEKNPDITEPSLEINFMEGKAHEVGSMVPVSYKATFKSGNYEFGPATGVSVIEWYAEDSLGNTANSFAANFDEVQVTDDLDYSITVTAKYSDGNMPYTNLQNVYEDGQIKAGEVSKISNSITGYRNCFYGTAVEKEDKLTSESIRNLQSFKGVFTPGQVINVNIPVGAYRVLFAYPTFLPELKSIVDINGLSAQILNSFKKVTVPVEGANNYEAIDYRVYYLDFAKAYDASNVFIFTIGEEED